MRHSERNDVNLAEVKAILGRLQRISRKPRAGGAQISDDHAAPLQPEQGASPADAEGGGIASPAAHRNMRPLVKAGVVIVPLVAIIAGIVIFVGTDRQPASTSGPSPDSAAQNPVPKGGLPAPVQAGETQPAPAKSQALLRASELAASGQVKAAREMLLRAMKDDTADVAWALARSYDPNFLKTIPSPDASPDVAEATRWYRAWYDIAVKQGLVSDSVSLERIIRSMN